MNKKVVYAMALWCLFGFGYSFIEVYTAPMTPNTGQWSDDADRGYAHMGVVKGQCLELWQITLGSVMLAPLGPLHPLGDIFMPILSSLTNWIINGIGDNIMRILHTCMRN